MSVSGEMRLHKCTSFAARVEGALVFLLVSPFKLACKRHPLKSEIGMTLQRELQRRGMGGRTISGLFSFL